MIVIHADIIKTSFLLMDFSITGLFFLPLETGIAN